MKLFVDFGPLDVVLLGVAALDDVEAGSDDPVERFWLEWDDDLRLLGAMYEEKKILIVIVSCPQGNLWMFVKITSWWCWCAFVDSASYIVFRTSSGWRWWCHNVWLSRHSLKIVISRCHITLGWMCRVDFAKGLSYWRHRHWKHEKCVSIRYVILLRGE